MMFPSFVRTRVRSNAIEVMATAVRSAAQIETTIVYLGQNPGSALIAAADTFIVVQRDVIIRLAETHRVPVIYPGYAVDQVRAGHQPQNRKNPWSNNSGGRAFRRGRGNRIATFLAAAQNVCF